MADPTDPTGDQVERMWRTIHRRVRRRRRARRVAVLAAALVLAGVLVAAVRGYGPWTFPREDPPALRCYSQVSADLGEDFPGTTVQAPAGHDPDPLAACAAVWATGTLGSPPGTLSPTAEAPDLVACRAGRLVLVYPGPPQTCDRLDLQPYLEEPRPTR